MPDAGENRLVEENNCQASFGSFMPRKFVGATKFRAGVMREFVKIQKPADRNNSAHFFEPGLLLFQVSGKTNAKAVRICDGEIT